MKTKSIYLFAFQKFHKKPLRPWEARVIEPMGSSASAPA